MLELFERYVSINPACPQQCSKLPIQPLFACWAITCTYLQIMAHPLIGRVETSFIHISSLADTQSNSMHDDPLPHSEPDACYALSKYYMSRTRGDSPYRDDRLKPRSIYF